MASKHVKKLFHLTGAEWVFKRIEWKLMNIQLYFINKKLIDQQRNISKYIYITLYFYVPFTPK